MGMMLMTMEMISKKRVKKSLDERSEEEDDELVWKQQAEALKERIGIQKDEVWMKGRGVMLEALA